MFLIKDRRFGMDKYVFTHSDPRMDGYKGDVIEDVTLEYDMNSIHFWPDGQPRPEPQLGRDPRNPQNYKVFKFPAELEAAGFEFVDSNAPLVPGSWSYYRKRYYPVPEEYAKTMTQDEWFEYLEEADHAAKTRKSMNEPAMAAPSGSRDQVAQWVVRRHMAADGGIYQILILDSGSPADEIRLLEVSERFTGDSAKIEPIDFVLDVNGAKYKVLVADISGDQLERIKGDPERFLPRNWKFGGAQIWERRGRRK